MLLRGVLSLTSAETFLPKTMRGIQRASEVVTQNFVFCSTCVFGELGRLAMQGTDGAL